MGEVWVGWELREEREMNEWARVREVEGGGN